jgi:hypothetical protein
LLGTVIESQISDLVLFCFIGLDYLEHPMTIRFQDLVRVFQVQIWCLLVVLLSAMLTSRMAAQEFVIQMSSGGGGDLANFGGLDGVPLVLAPVPGYMPVEADRLVSMPRVASDLQLLPDQQQSLQSGLKAIRDRFAPRREALHKQLSDAKTDGQRQEISDALGKLEQELRDEVKSAIDDVLLPFQKKRLDQIVAQSKLNNDSRNALQSEEFAKLLNLTDDQKKELDKKQEEMRAKLQEEIRELRLKRQREVLEAALTKDQQEKLKELIGNDLAPAEKPTAKKQNER